MDKEEILARVKNQGIDEREQQVMSQSFGFGAIVVVILCFIFSIIKAIEGQRFHEFAIIIFAYLSASNFYQYKKIGEKKYLIVGSFATITVILGFIGYFLIR